MINTLILTEGGKENGFGHIARSLSLYESFVRKNISVKLIINGDETVNNFIKGIVFTNHNWLDEPDFVLENIRNYKAVIIDSYKAPLDFYERVKEKNVNCVFIDDYQRIEYPDSLIINTSLSKKSDLKNLSSSSKYLIGQQYAMLRSGFNDLPGKVINKSIKKILVTIGGSDNQGVTTNIVDELSKNFSFEINVVLGNVTGKNKLLLENNENNINVFESLSSSEMINLMAISDVAITAGGQTIYELASAGVPCIAILTAENQRGNINNLLKNKAVIFAGSVEQKIFIKNIINHINDLLSYSARKKLSENAQETIDGKGADRVTDLIINKSIL